MPSYEELKNELARTLHKPSPPEINRNDVELINFQVKIPQPQDIGQKGWRLLGGRIRHIHDKPDRRVGVRKNCLREA
jgi:hypothetical protein